MKQPKRRIDKEDRSYQKVLNLLVQEGVIADTTSRESVQSDYLAELKKEKEDDDDTEEE